MKRKISSFHPSSLRQAMTSSSTSTLQRATREVRPRFPAPASGALWDPFLLDRLQAPLTRHHD